MPNLKEIEKLNKERTRVANIANLVDNAFFMDAESIKILEANNVTVEEFLELVAIQSKFYTTADAVMYGYSSENLFITEKDLILIRKILGISKNDLAYIIGKDIMTKILAKLSNYNLNEDRRDVYYPLLEGLTDAIRRSNGVAIEDKDDLLLSINRIRQLIVLDPTDLTRVDRWDFYHLESDLKYGLKDTEGNFIILTEGYNNIVILKNNLIIELIKGSADAQNKLYEDLLSHTYTNNDNAIYYSKLFSAYIAS